MQYTALLTRSYAGLDESIQIIVDDVADLAEFKEKVYDALRITDYRGNQHMQHLFEDTTLTDTLDYKELKSAQEAIKILYPSTTIPSKLDLGLPKGGIEFAKILPQGETLKLFLHEVENYEDLATAIKGIFAIIDSRLVKTNQRELDIREHLKKLDMTTRLKIMNILDILYGSQFGETVIEKLKQAKLDEEMEKIRESVATEAKE